MIDVIINNEVVGTFNSITEACDSEIVTEAQIKVSEGEIKNLSPSEITKLRPIFRKAR